MTNKLALLLGALSACAITTSNAMEEKKAPKRSVTVDDAFLDQHYEEFKGFIQKMGWGKKAVDVMSWIPGGMAAVKIGTEFTPYAGELDNRSFLNRLLANEAQIDLLKRDRECRELTSEYLSNVSSVLAQESDQGRKKFLLLLHAQNIKTLELPEDTTQKGLCELVNKRSESGQPEIPDERYTPTTIASLFTVFAYENGLLHQPSDKN